MEKETKKKSTTSAKKTTSGKKATSTKTTASTKKATGTKKTTTGSKQNKPVKKVNETNKRTTETKKVTKKVVEEVEKKNKNTTSTDKSLVKEDKKVIKSKDNDAKVEKTNNKVKETTLGEELKSFIKSDIGSLIGIILIIVLVMGGFFFITDFIKGLNEEEEELIASQDVQYDEILLSSILKQPNNSYYVLIYDKGSEVIDSKDIDVQTYEIYLDIYMGQDDALRIYTSNLNQKFNQAYVTEEETKLLVSDVAELKVKSTTLVKVENGKIVSAFDTRDSIIEHLASIIK